MAELAILSSILIPTIILISFILLVLLKDFMYTNCVSVGEDWEKSINGVKVSKVNLAFSVANTGCAGINRMCRGLGQPRLGKESQKV
jgi:hypothetical protein